MCSSLPEISDYKHIIVYVAARNAIVVVIAAVLAGMLYRNDVIPFSLTSNISSGFPSWSAPQFEVLHGNKTVTSVSETFQVSHEITGIYLAVAVQWLS